MTPEKPKMARMAFQASSLKSTLCFVRVDLGRFTFSKKGKVKYSSLFSRKYMNYNNDMQVVCMYCIICVRFFRAKFAGLPHLPENWWKGVASDYGQVKTTSLKIIGIEKHSNISEEKKWCTLANVWNYLWLICITLPRSESPSKKLPFT